MDIADERKIITDNDIVAVVSSVKTATTRPASSGPWIHSTRRQQASTLRCTNPDMDTESNRFNRLNFAL